MLMNVVMFVGFSHALLDCFRQGRTQDFLKGGGGIFFPCIVASRVRKIIYTLITMLQASSVLPYSKKLKKQTSKMQITQYNGRNPKKYSVFRSQGVPRPPPSVGAPLVSAHCPLFSFSFFGWIGPYDFRKYGTELYCKSLRAHNNRHESWPRP